jgi:hypothetical protein
MPKIKSAANSELTNFPEEVKNVKKIIFYPLERKEFSCPASLYENPKNIKKISAALYIFSCPTYTAVNFKHLTIG